MTCSVSFWLLAKILGAAHEQSNGRDDEQMLGQIKTIIDIPCHRSDPRNKKVGE
jgi:hypothetical protein